MAPQKILIVGCGIAGPVLASFLLLTDTAATEKPHITILERATELRAQGQNVDIRGAGVDVIRKLGLETAIKSNLTGEVGVKWVDNQDRVWGQFAADMTGKVQTGTSDIEIMRGRLGQLCYDRSKTLSDEVQEQGGHGIEYIFGDYLDKIDQQGDSVVVQSAKSGAEKRFDLVVGADGLQSRTRRLVWGEDAEKEHVYRLGTYGGFFSMPKGEKDDAWRRWMHIPQRRSIMLRPSHDPSLTTAFMVVLSDTDKRLEDAASRELGGVERQKELLDEYFRGTGWETDRVLREMHAADDFYFAEVAQIKMDKWSKGRVVLLADAGYCASPISGMGTTLALTGAYSLAGALVTHTDHTAALAEYEETMRPVVQKAQKLAPGAPHSIHPETAFGLRILHLIVWLITVSRLQLLLFSIAGPPANKVSVKEYGFRSVTDGWKMSL